MIKLPIQDRRLIGLKVGFIGGLVASAGFGLSFLVEAPGWILMVSGFVIGLLGGLVHVFMVLAQIGDLLKRKNISSDTGKESE